MSLASFPEELIEHILEHVVIAPQAPQPRASWHTSSPSGKETRGRTAPLLVSRAFHRIALPLFYHTLVIHSPRQAAGILRALSTEPALARAVRVLVLPAVGSGGAVEAKVLGMLPKLQLLDITLPPNSNSSEGGGASDEIQMLCRAIKQLRTLRAVSVCKPSGTYLSQPAPRALLEALAVVVDVCTEVHTATLSFPLSSDPSLYSLTSALSHAPALRTLRTPLPSLPGAAPAYVAVAENAALERVCLGANGEDTPMPMESCGPFEPSLASGGCASAPVPASAAVYPGKDQRERCLTYPSYPHRATRPLLSTSLFITAARSHPRLSELIRAGTNIVVGWRGRAATVGAC